MNIRQPHSRQRGFTLIELLIAVVIFALALAAINGVFYGAMRLRTRTAQMIEQSLPIQQTVAILRRDLKGLVAPNGPLTGALQTGMSTTAGVGQQGGTDFYTATGTLSDAAPWGDVQKVTYALRTPETQPDAGGKDLVRLVTRNLLPTSETQVVEEFLMSGVERIAFAYFDGTDWKETWDSTTVTNGLPLAIKVQIELAAEETGRPARTPIQIVVPVVCQSITNQVAAAEAASGGGQ